MPKKINHIGIAVNDIQEAARFYTEQLGLQLGGIEEVSDRKVKVAFLDPEADGQGPRCGIDLCRGSASDRT